MLTVVVNFTLSNSKYCRVQQSLSVQEVSLNTQEVRGSERFGFFVNVPLFFLCVSIYMP